MTCIRPNTPRSDPHDWSQLNEPLRSELHQLCVDYDLYPVSLYRDPGRQWDLRHERTPGHECGPFHQYPGHPTTALPAQFINGVWVGGSKHQHGEAGDVGGARLSEAKANCKAYGLKASVPDEDWHFEDDPTINPTVPITPFNSIPTPIQPQLSEDDMTPEQEKMLAGIYAEIVSKEEGNFRHMITKRLDAFDLLTERVGKIIKFLKVS